MRLVVRISFSNLQEDAKTKLATRKSIFFVAGNYLERALTYSASHDFVEHRHPVLTAVEGSLGLFTTTQEEDQPLDDYLARLLAQIEQIKAHQGRPWRHPKLVELM